ncbi:hypothetical protein JW964_22115, partial [candidate division KSB1 bacterium]|nr:hypothetical protein [candidate division KSB1 bacterium]
HILKFINREYEKREIINPGENKLIVVNAPLGYGKTRLLNEVKEWYKKGNAPDWFCALINLDNAEFKRNPSVVIKEISKQIFKQLHNIKEAEDLIVHLIGQHQNFLILFDNAETNFEAVTYLQNEFINPLNQALNKTKIMGRFVFAGRYMRRPDWDWTGYKFINLTVLDENIVRNAILTELDRYNLNPSVTAIVAHEITSLSVGHPGIIDNIIRSYPPGRWALYIQHNSLALEEKVKIFETYVMPTIDTILNEFQDEIHKKILCILSIFRKFNLNHIMALKLLAEGIAVSKNNPTQVNELLKQVSTQDFLEPFKKLRQDPISLLTQLVKTGLVSGPTLEKPYFHDDIIRKLLILKMELDKENNTHYKLTQMAITIYDTWIEGKNLNGEWLPIPPSDMIQIEYIIESFYHFLKWINYQKPQNSMPMISDKVDWYIQKLRWGLFPKDWMQSTLYNTLQMDEEIPKLLNDLVGESEKNEILKRFKFDLL